MSALAAPRGTADALPADAAARDRVVAVYADVAARYGYGRIETPMFEDTAVFERGVGASTDIVHKEMYTFADRGDRSLTLRPEGTAPIARAYVEHGMTQLPQPVKLWYAGPMFRYERVQRGRQRQFGQFGAEAIGSADPLLDVEVICLLVDTLAALGLGGLSVHVNSLGDPADRDAYRDRLVAHLEPHRERLTDDGRRRLAENPLRLLDDKDPTTRELLAGAPALPDVLGEAATAHHRAVLDGLSACGVDTVDDPGLVRGFDYYTRTLFEVISDSAELGSQSAVAGGGRYDHLIAALGGPQVPGIGFAAGIERILLTGAGAADEPALDAWLLAADPAARPTALALARRLRGAGASVDLDFAGRSEKGQRRQADRRRARFVVTVTGGGEAAIAVSVDDRARADRTDVPPEELPTWLTDRLTP